MTKLILTSSHTFPSLHHIHESKPALEDAYRRFAKHETIMQINLRSSIPRVKCTGFIFKPSVERKKGLVVEFDGRAPLVIARALARRKYQAGVNIVRAGLECAALRSVRQDSRIGRYYFVSINRRMGTWSNRPSLVGSSSCGWNDISDLASRTAISRPLRFVRWILDRHARKKLYSPV